MREREDEVYIRHVEQLPLARGQPPGARLRLTLGTVSIPAGVIRDGPMPASPALIDVPAEGGGPTPRDRAQHRPLLHAEPRMLVDEVLTLRVEDSGPLPGGPGHGCAGLRSNRDRGRTTGRVTWSCSRGVGAAWRWRRERWR